MPCSRARLTPSSGSTPTAAATPQPCWTETAGCGPPWRCQATGWPMPGCSGWPMPGPRPAGVGLEGTGCDGAGLTQVLVDQGEWVDGDRPAQAAPRPPRGHQRRPAAIRAGIVAAGADARRQLKAPIVTAQAAAGPPAGASLAPPPAAASPRARASARSAAAASASWPASCTGSWSAPPPSQPAVDAQWEHLPGRRRGQLSSRSRRPSCVVRCCMPPAMFG